MRHAIPRLTLAGGVLLIAAAIAAAPGVRAQEGHGTQGDTLAPLRGAAVYAEFCQACHGPRGEAIGTGPAFGAIAFNADTARAAITEGVDAEAGDGATMPPYARVLSAAQIDDVMAYMETWESGHTPPLPEPNIRVEVERVPDYFGDPAAGAVVYARFCAGCHGVEGKGRAKPDFPPVKLTRHTARVVREGSASKAMPAFGTAAGGPLSDAQIADVETYMASWALKPEEKESTGLSVLLVVVGVVAIVTIGLAYLSRMVYTE